MPWYHRLRPNVILGLLILGVLGGLALWWQVNEITAGAVGGIIALLKDVVASDGPLGAEKGAAE